jgi:hypothetical protein
MKVSDLMPKLVKNEDYVITIADEDNRNIITFNPTGYVGLSAELNDRTVNEILIADTKKVIKITLEAVEEPEPDPDPDPSNP